ncbi:MAG: acylphosphatase [Cellvibrionaceae bacterium]|jgi:acylphosphatase
MSKAVRIHISGQVQGVFYRATAREQAQNLRLNGWIKNEIDGSVMAHIQGESQALDQWLQWARQGPETAKVSGIDISEAGHEPLNCFEIRYR